MVLSWYCGKTADSIEMPFGVVGRLGPRNDEFDEYKDVVKDGEAACFQITSGHGKLVGANTGRVYRRTFRPYRPRADTVVGSEI